MQPVNYDSISTIYDDVRRADLELIQHFVSQLELTSSTRVLDLGCGTGNYLDLFQRVSLGKFYGVEPSTGMDLKASCKNSHIIITTGNAYSRFKYRTNKEFVQIQITTYPSIKSWMLN